MSDSAERTLDPTDARREEFRKQGRFARARDAGGVVATVAVIAMLAGSEGALSGASRRLFAETLGDLSALERLGTVAVLERTLGVLLEIAGPTVAAAVAAAVIVGVVQSGLRPYTEMLEPKLDRLDPRQGLARLFGGKRAALETAVALARVGLVGAVAWNALSKELPHLVALSRVPLGAAVGSMLGALARAGGMAVAALFVIAALDYAQSRWTLSGEMKMTRKEREDEAKQSEGDAKAKGRMKARARALARKRALSAVKSADVVVTNPTHVAVALRYGPKDAAPVVIAKGHDEVALRIRAEARKHGIPILENRPLARALDAEVPIGRPVPAAHFAAVARVLAYVYRLPGRKRRSR